MNTQHWNSQHGTHKHAATVIRKHKHCKHLTRPVCNTFNLFLTGGNKEYSYQLKHPSRKGDAYSQWNTSKTWTRTNNKNAQKYITHTPEFNSKCRDHNHVEPIASNPLHVRNGFSHVPIAISMNPTGTFQK
jgi:hypothetical protein